MAGDLLFTICVKTIFLNPLQCDTKKLPLKLQNIFRLLKTSVDIFRSTLQDLTSAENIVNSCLVINPSTYLLDNEKTVAAMEKHLSIVDFFDLCARYALDVLTELVFEKLSRAQRFELMGRHSAVKARLFELYNDRSDNAEFLIFYDDVALDCASSGYLQALDRSFMKIEDNTAVDEALLPKCVLLAILNGHYHIANHIICGDNYDKAFYSVFPDGRVPAQFFATLLDDDLIKEGEKIATSLLKYLPKFDIQYLRRTMELDNLLVRSGALRRFDTLYGEILEQRDYPCDID